MGATFIVAPIFYYVMCGYVGKEGACLLDNNKCPYMYYCTRYMAWRPSNAMPVECKKTIVGKLPNGTYKVVQYKRQLLYIDIGNQIITLPNPFPFVPLTVKMVETTEGWEILTDLTEG